nr:MAG TPA: hypothetical protein [Caudoviricetes sp.]
MLFYLMANLSIFLNLRISNCVKHGRIVIYLIKTKKREILKRVSPLIFLITY